MSDGPRVLLVGAGPVGTMLAAALAGNGVRFDWHVRNPARREQLADGFIVHLQGSVAQQQLVTNDSYALLGELSQPASYEMLILAVRGTQADELLAALRREVEPARLLLVANGLVTGPCQLGLLYGGAYLDVAGLHTGEHSRLFWGALGTSTAGLAGIEDALGGSWLEVSYSEQMEIMMWHKLCLNCVVNPLTALLGCQNGALLPFAEAPLISSVLEECSKVARKVLRDDWQYSLEDLREGLIYLLAGTETNISSMLRDIKYGRTTEIEVLNSAVARLGRRFDLPCPFNEALSASIIALANKRSL